MEKRSLVQAMEMNCIYTGTPAGVAALQPGDRILLSRPQMPGAHWKIG